MTILGDFLNLWREYSLCYFYLWDMQPPAFIWPDIHDKHHIMLLHSFILLCFAFVSLAQAFKVIS